MLGAAHTPLNSGVRRQTNQRRNCDKSLAHTHRIPRHLAGDRRHDILCCHLLGWPARRRPTSMDRASSPHSRLVGGDSLSHPRCPQSLATNWQGQIDVFWQLRRQLQLHCRHWRQHEHWHFWHLPPNNSFKPNLLRSTKAMAERACHGFGSTTQVGLTQALGCAREFDRFSATETSQLPFCSFARSRAAFDLSRVAPKQSDLLIRLRSYPNRRRVGPRAFFSLRSAACGLDTG